MKPGILIFSTIHTARLQYILNWIFAEQLQLHFDITNDREQWENFEGPKINYSQQKSDVKSLHIIPQGLLGEDNIQPQALSVNRWKHSTILFYNQPGAVIPFDIFSAAFYLITRYEEYLPHKKDKHGRYNPEQSVAMEYAFLQQPVVDEWILHFGKMLHKHLGILLPEKQFRFIPTYDIDIAWKYLYKGSKRQWGGLLKDLLSLKFNSVKDRLQVYAGKAKDPFDCFDWLDGMHIEFGLQPIYFMLLGSLSAYDKNADPKLPAMQALLKALSRQYDMGIHPSYLSNDDDGLLHQEIKILEEAIQQNITKSRQHYIKLSLPETYERLIAAGIQDDYTMGYASANGFRAGTSNSFKWYHLNEERETGLRVHPFAFMEATNKFYLKQNVRDAWLEWERLYHAVKHTNGTFITIWHNYILGTDKNSKGWRELYLKGLNQLSTSNQKK